MKWIDKFFRPPGRSQTESFAEENVAALGKDPGKPQSSTPVTLAELQKLVPCNQLSSAELSSFLPNCKCCIFAPGERLFTRGQKEGSAWYLRSGEVALDFGNQSRIVKSSSSIARYPLSCGQPYAADGIALSTVEALCLPEAMMMTAVHKKRARPIKADKIFKDFKELPKELRKSEVFYTFWRSHSADSVQFPPLPQVALRLRKAISEEIGIEEAAKIIQTDPIVTARLIEIANSPLYRGVSRVTTCQQAVGRIGLMGVRNLVTSLTLKQMFHKTDPRLMRWLQRLWQDSVRVSCFSYVLGTCLPHIDAEQALLAGLMSNIGALPFLYFAAEFPSETLPDSVLTAAIACVKGPLGSELLSAWEFPSEIYQVPKFCDDWFYSDEGTLTLTDVVILANWHAHLGRAKTGALPPIETLPTYQKLNLRKISPEFSLDLLHTAQDQIEQVRRFFQ